MPFQGYQQDLCWLTGEQDCLLSLADSPTKLTENSHLESKNKEYQNLSEFTLGAMMLLNTDSMKAGEAETLSLPPTTPSVTSTNTSPFGVLSQLSDKLNCEEKGLINMAPPINQSSRSTPLSANLTLRSQERAPVSTQTAANYLLDLEEAQGEQIDIGSLLPAAASPSAIQYRPHSRKIGKDERGAFTSKCITHPKSITLILYPVPPDYTRKALSLMSQDNTKIPTITSKSTHMMAFTDGMEQLTKPLSVSKLPASSLISENMIILSPSKDRDERPSLPSVTSATVSVPPNPADSDLPLLTALGSRTDAQVIADLKRLRPSPSAPTKRRQTSLSHYVPADSDLTDVQEQSNGAEADGNPVPEPDDLDAYNDEDDEDEDVLPSTRPRKISERKRRMNAIADIYIQEMAQKSLKEDIQNNCYKTEDQSARYIINQAESQKIISTPREYQTELFERAKEKNTIAVLDTGKQMKKLNVFRLTFQAPGKP